MRTVTLLAIFALAASAAPGAAAMQAPRMPRAVHCARAQGRLHHRQGPHQPDLPRQSPRLFYLHRPVHARRCRAAIRSRQHRRFARRTCTSIRAPSRPTTRRRDSCRHWPASEWLDADRFPELTFRSQSVELIGANSFRIHGQLTLHGVTRPMVLEAKYNGGYAGHPYEPQARVGFSAQGSFKRSDFGVSYGIPDPGSSFGVGDEIDGDPRDRIHRPRRSPPTKGRRWGPGCRCRLSPTELSPDSQPRIARLLGTPRDCN